MTRLIKKLFIGFKGKNNSSNLLVQDLTQSGHFLTNSFAGVKRDIDKIEHDADIVYMFGIDKSLIDEVRIESSAKKEEITVYSSLDLKQLSEHLNSVGVKNYIADNPTAYLCNEAYWHALNRFDRKCVFIHIPSIRNFKEDLPEKIKRGIV